jgi:ornithine cyclodeaminase
VWREYFIGQPAARLGDVVMSSAPQIFTAAQIDAALADFDPLTAITNGFIDYSAGKATVPPVGELLMPERRGELHIKYGAVRDDWCYVVKLASGFYDNPALGLPSGNGLLLVFSQWTGELLAILLDQGRLTRLRTAVAGAVVARQLAPAKVECIGLIGTGAQARLQAHWLKKVIACRRIALWGRSRERVEACAADLVADGFTVTALASPEQVVVASDLVVTTTASSQPLIPASAMHSRLHVTAMGSDVPHKREMDSRALARATVIVADSRAQCRLRGEISHALRDGAIDERAVVELGDVLAGRAVGRERDGDITVADLTGVAVQDIAIAKAALDVLAPEIVHRERQRCAAGGVA